MEPVPLLDAGGRLSVCCCQELGCDRKRSTVCGKNRDFANPANRLVIIREVKLEDLHLDCSFDALRIRVNVHVSQKLRALYDLFVTRHAGSVDHECFTDEGCFALRLDVSPKVYVNTDEANHSRTTRGGMRNLGLLEQHWLDVSFLPHSHADLEEPFVTSPYDDRIVFGIGIEVVQPDTLTNGTVIARLDRPSDVVRAEALPKERGDFFARNDPRILNVVHYASIDVLLVGAWPAANFLLRYYLLLLKDLKRTEGKPHR